MKIRLPVVSGTYGVIGPSGEEIYGMPSDPVRPKYFDQFQELRECHLDYFLGAQIVEATAPIFPDALLNLPDVEVLDDTVLTFETAIQPEEPIVQPKKEPPEEVPEEGTELEPDEELPEDADLDEQPEEETPLEEEE